MGHLQREKGTEPKIRYNKWRREKTKARGEGVKDELAATIRLSVKICTGGRGQATKPPRNQPKRGDRINMAGKDCEETLARDWSSISMRGYTGLSRSWTPDGSSQG